MGLTYPSDVAAWQAWSARRRPMHRVRALRALLRRGRGESLRAQLSVSGSRPRVLVVVESAAASSRAALVDPIEHLVPHVDVALLSSAPVTLPAQTRWTTRQVEVGDESPLPDIDVLLFAGHYLPLGAAAERWAQTSGALVVVSQHGLITPAAPPLPPGAHLLSWTDDDGTYWASGRSDITSHAVGSQLLWRAAQDAASAPVRASAAALPVLYLGQLHGAEIGRRDMARAAGDFCRMTGAHYRPHPSESDLLSRLQHARWRRQGITIGDSATPLAQLSNPVVSVYSTGTLEAAARGADAWVAHPDPPEWLREFWDRYGMSPWGTSPTRAAAPGSTEPAREMARYVLDRVGEQGE